jgi:hypothetical protein
MQSYDEYVIKNRVRSMTDHAIKHGVLVRPPNCEECGVECKPQAHHIDYDWPLAVEFLCRKCHKQRHPMSDEHRAATIAAFTKYRDEQRRVIKQERTNA